MQVGKYNGTLPFIIEASGVYQTNGFSQQFHIPENEIYNSDSLTKTIWVGNYIKDLENQTSTNDIVSEIIDYSIDERVLSLYTAFLCLEPDRGGEVCYDCLDETELLTIFNETSVESEIDSTIWAYPNPFNSQIKIKLRIPAHVKKDNISFKIHNVLGQVVRTFQFDVNQNGTTYIFEWDGKNDVGSPVSTGSYFFVASMAETKYIKKLLFLK